MDKLSFFLFTEVAYLRVFCCRCTLTAGLPLLTNPSLHCVTKERVLLHSY